MPPARPPSTVAVKWCASKRLSASEPPASAIASGIPFNHLERGRPWSWHRSPRHEPAVDSEIDAKQIEHSDGGHREANREREARVLAGVHERETEGCEAQGRRGFRGGEARAPARQHRQSAPPADEH